MKSILNKIVSFDGEKTLAKWWKGNPISAKSALFTALIMGFVTHLYVYTNLFMNEDNFNFYRSGANIGSGRWFNNVINNLNYLYTPPITVGLFQVIFLSLSAFFVVKVFKIQSKWHGFIIGGLICTFPPIAYINGYFYEAAGYMFGGLLSVLAFYITVKYKLGFVIGGGLIMLTMAIYQSKVSIALSLCLFYLIIQLNDEDFNIKLFVQNVLKFGLMAIIGGVSYIASTRITTRLQGTQLSDYKGISNMHNIDIAEIPNLLKTTYKSFIAGFFGNHYYYSDYLRYSYILVGAIAAVFLIAVIIKQKTYKKLLNIAGILFLTALIPLATNTSAFFSGAASSTLEMYPIVFFFVLPIALVERCSFNFLLKSWLKPIFIFSCLFMIGSFIIASNIFYLNLDVFYQRTYSLTTRILTRIDPLIHLSASNKVAILGSINSENYPQEHDSSVFMFKRKQIRTDGLWGQFIGFNQPIVNETYKFVGNVRSYHGISLGSVNRTEYDEVRAKAMAARMPVWPAEGSVALIDDIVVVNFEEIFRFVEHEMLGDNTVRFNLIQSNKNLEHLYAFYIYFNNKRIETKWYTDEDWVDVDVSISGNYHVGWFIQDVASGFSDVVIIQ